jgi:hypothetical protein
MNPKFEFNKRFEQAYLFLAYGSLIIGVVMIIADIYLLYLNAGAASDGTSRFMKPFNLFLSLRGIIIGSIGFILGILGLKSNCVFRSKTATLSEQIGHP